MGGVESLLTGPTYTIEAYKVTKVKQLAEGGFSFVVRRHRNIHREREGVVRKNIV